jgi:adhesin/invasin
MYSARFKNWIFIFFCLLGAGAARAQSITLISGNGQLLDTSPHSQSQPMIVLVRDASGNPVKGATVSWTVTPTGQGNVLSAKTTTDATGQSTNLFTAESGNLNSKSFVQSTVTASAEGGSVQFTLTTVEFNGAVDYDNVVLLKPTTRGETLVGQAGATQNGAIEVQVVGANGGTQEGQGIPNVSVAVVQGDPKDTSTLSCSGGSVVYTDTTGTAICNLVFGGLVGTGTFTIVIGGTSEFGGYSYQVKAGAPAAFINILGNNQSGNPGQSLRLLSATLTDLGGNPVPNTPVTFTPVGAVTLSRVSTTTDANGNAACQPPST